MPKITSQEVKRLHITLFQTEYDQLEAFSNEIKSPMSKIVRELIREFLSARQIKLLHDNLLAFEESEYD